MGQRDSYRDEIVSRISECQTVIGELQSSAAWKILLKDMEMERARIDDNWQSILEPDKLAQARVLKLAVMHLLNLIKKYEHDLDSSQKEIEKYDRTDTNILKDYDTEGIT